MCRFESPAIGLFFGRRILSIELSITGDGDVQQAASTFVNAREEPDLKRCMDVWETFAGFMQTFPSYVI